MKIIAINGSPRKGWNSFKLLDKWKEGVLSVLPDAEVKEVNLYDLQFTGCRSCFACKMKGGKFFGTCPIPDGIHDLLAEIRQADAVAIAVPIYFGDINAYAKCLIERMIYSVMTYGNPPRILQEKPVDFTMLYSMNATEQYVKEHNYLSRCFETEATIGWAYHCKVRNVIAYDTYQFADYSKYEAEMFSEPHKRKQHDEQFPKDLQAAFDTGAQVAGSIQQGSIKGNHQAPVVHF